MKKYFFILLLIFEYYSLPLFAQELPNIIPPAPNAAALGQYSDTPVNNYTGIPSISIPLYSIKVGALDIPISLSYHASGNRVAQEASWVGLGWALNAGGVITRQVQGIDDFSSWDGYLTTFKFPPSTPDNLPDLSIPNQLNEYYNPIKNKNLDGEPDIFYYNFLGYSGKILFSKQTGDILNGISTQQNNLKFNYTKSTKTWIITDGNGIKYHFGGLTATERTYNFGSSSDTSPDHINIHIPDVLSAVADKNQYDTSWFLTKIETPKNQEVNFYYDNSYYSLSRTHYNEIIYNIMSHDNIRSQGNGYISSTLKGTYKLFSGSRQANNETYLNRIEFPNGSLVFNKENRIDIEPYGNNESPKRLKSITLFNQNNERIKEVQFRYKYMNEGVTTDSYDWLRLQLDNIQEYYGSTNNETTKPPYRFTYNEINLPKKTSYSIDHWGYFNGHVNDKIAEYETSINIEPYISNNRPRTVSEAFEKSELKMLAPLYESIGENKVFINGANREINEGVVQAGILQSISNPLGAVTHFAYESNDYSSDSEDLYTYIPKSYSAYQGVNKSFTLDDYTMVYFDAIIDDDDNENAVYNSNYLNMSLTKEGFGEVIKVKPNSIGSPPSFSSSFKVVLPPGNYTLWANYSQESELVLSFKARYNEKEITEIKKGGGVRIREITVEDNNLIQKKKIYEYDFEDHSSGRLVSPLQYFYNETLVSESVIPIPGNVIHYIYQADYLVRSSNSIIPLGNSAQGNPIGYDKVSVSETSLEHGDLGRSEYFYANEEEVPNENFMPGVPNLINLNNGQLLSQIHYNSQNKIVFDHTLEYTENRDTQISTKGVKLYSFFGSNSVSISGARFYDIFSKWRYLSKEVKTTYDENGNTPVSVTTEYQYNNPLHKNITQTKLTDSKSQVLKTKMYYPDDILNINTLPNTTQSEYDTLNRFKYGNLEHHPNQLIQQETLINDVLTSLERSNFTTVNEITLPSVIKYGKNINTIENRIIYHSYDNKGNPTEISQANGTHIAYIWGYDSQYPVAKIENATYAQVSNYVSNIQSKSNQDNDRTLNYLGKEGELRQALDNLRSVLPNAMVSTYTYDPLIGITSMTDPRGYTTYYEYDAFNRLQTVKDTQGNVLSENKYNYKN